MSKSLYSHDHILWKINKMRGYTMVNLSWKWKKRRYPSAFLILKWRNNPLPSYFFTKIVSKSHYYYDHILWKSIKWGGYTIVICLEKIRIKKKIWRYTNASLIWKWRNITFKPPFFIRNRVKITLLSSPCSLKNQ